MWISGSTSGPADLEAWQFLQRREQQGFDVEALPEALQAIVRERPADFAEGDADRIDTDNELRQLLDAAIGADPRALPNQPGGEALQGLDKSELLALLVDWISNGNAEQRNRGGGGGRDLGRMNAPSFASGPQPSSWGGGGGGSSGGGGGVSSSSGGASSAGSITPTQAADLRGNTNAERAFNYFVDKGLTEQQAAGIVGNLMVESGVDPTISQHGGGPGRGIAQWTVGARWTGVEQLAAQTGRSSGDLGVQLDFIWQELNSTESGALSALRQTSTAADAARVFSDKYERPGIPHMDRRIGYANEALTTYA